MRELSKNEMKSIKGGGMSATAWAVIAGFLVSGIYLIVTMYIEKNINFTADGLSKKLLGFLLGIIVLGITCFIDDVKNIKPLAKLAGQTCYVFCP